MDRRTFNSLMHYNNETWAARALRMNVNPSKGPDLIDSQKVVEVKFRLIKQNTPSYLYWTAFEYQKKYGENKEAYWALGTYILDREIELIPNSTIIQELEKTVKHRELFLVKWDWMNQFTTYREKGETKQSKWDHILIFPKGKLLPKTEETYEVAGGKINITCGVDSIIFK